MEKYFSHFSTFAGSAIIFDLLGRWLFGSSDIQILGVIALSIGITVLCHKTRKVKSSEVQKN